MSRPQRAALIALGGWLCVVGFAHAAGWFFLAGLILGGGVGFGLGGLFMLLVQESLNETPEAQPAPARSWRRHLGL